MKLRRFFTLFTRLLSRFLMGKWLLMHTLLIWSARVCYIRWTFPRILLRNSFPFESRNFDEMMLDWGANGDETAQRPRQVGVCMKHLPHDEDAMFNSSNVPWQRVINSKGAVSPRWAIFCRDFNTCFVCKVYLRVHMNAILVSSYMKFQRHLTNNRGKF